MSNIKFINAFETPFFTIEKSLENYSDDAPYFRINTKDSIICCLLDEGDNLLLAEQLRPNLGYRTIEFPAGGVEDEESPIDAAAREIREEMGVECLLVSLGSYRLIMNRTINKEHLFIGLTSGELTSQTEQGIKTRVIPRKKLINTIYANELEQLAALGIIQLINLKFGINFLSDDKVINKIWK
jgi:8-oxo-dGTP pyrophosphatase MutT (NUDIX family)